jgi:hypothetical protein
MRPDEPALGTAQPTSCTFDPKLTAKRTSLQFVGLPHPPSTKQVINMAEIKAKKIYTT